MLLGGKLLSFAFRALILVMLIPLVLLTVAERYNTALVAVAKNLVGDTPSLSVLGTRIMIEYSPATLPFSLGSLTLHSGLVLLSVFALASVGVDILPRIGWLVTYRGHVHPARGRSRAPHPWNRMVLQWHRCRRIYAPRTQTFRDILGLDPSPNRRRMDIWILATKNERATAP